MSSVYSRLIIERYEDSFGILEDTEEDLMGLSRNDVINKVNKWTLFK